MTLRIGGPGDAALDLWLVHALGDSSAAFCAAFAQPLAATFRILAPDLPGHGAMPAQAAALTVDAAAAHLAARIEEISRGRQTALVGHSMGSILAVRAAGRLARAPRLVVSVEGNLVAEDAYFTGRACAFDSPQAYRDWLAGEIARLAQDHPALSRYEASLRASDARMLWTLGRSVARVEHPGLEYAALPCPHRSFDDAGHWPMVSAADRFYGALALDLRDPGTWGASP